METSEELYEKKIKLCLERDLCSELYNVWITKLYEYQKDPEKYEMYISLISNIEPYADSIKREIRALNKKICENEGVENILDTKYTHECVEKYGFLKSHGGL
jgi:hypothetical protein